MEKTNGVIAIIEEFKQYLIADGKSSSTIESYVGDVTGFLEWLEEKGHEFNGEMRRLYVTSFWRYLVEEGLEVATINKKVNSLFEERGRKMLGMSILHYGDLLQEWFSKNNFTSHIIRISTRHNRGRIIYTEIQSLNLLNSLLTQEVFIRIMCEK